MAAVYASTTREWFDALSLLRPERAAFWQPTPARPSRIAAGERWYFKELGAPQILGYGEFSGWERLTIAGLFEDYGLASGYASEVALLSAFHKFDPNFTSTTQIGNVILENVTPFESPVSLLSIGLDDLSVRFVYIEGDDPIAAYVGGLRPDSAPVTAFSLRNPEAAKREATKRKVRVGQSAFRRLLIQTYGNVCAFTGAQLQETLQAAHIQPYVDAESNHVRNGLLLRADVHVLFDLGLLTLTNNLHIKVSSKLQGRAPIIEALEGTMAKLENAAAVKPSDTAVSFHRDEIFVT